MARTTKRLFGNGYTTYGKNGSKYTTTKNVLGNGYTTYGDNGTKYTTTKDVFGSGYTTYGNNGTKYTTTKDIFSDGYTTHGSDGSTYKSHKQLFGDGYSTIKTSGPIKSSAGEVISEVAGDIGGSLILVVVAIVLLQICFNTLTFRSYVFIAGVLIAPRLCNLCDRLRLSPLWCSSVLYSYIAYGMISSVYSDVRVVAGTTRASEGLIVIFVLVMILLLSIFFAVMNMESVIGFFSFFVMLISISWCFFDGLHAIPYTPVMTHLAMGLLILFAAIDQFTSCSR